MLAGLIAAIVVAAMLAGGLVYALKKLADAHTSERLALAAQAQDQRDLHELLTQKAVIEQSLEEFRTAHLTLTAEYDDLSKRLVQERARAERAERHRDDLIRQLADKQDPTALVAAINDELAALRRPLDRR